MLGDFIAGSPGEMNYSERFQTVFKKLMCCEQIFSKQEAAHSFNSGHLKLSDCVICVYMYISPLTKIRFHISHKLIYRK